MDARSDCGISGVVATGVINADKLLHLLIGLAIAMPMMYFFHSSLAAIVLVSVVALIKEVEDYRHQDRHTCDGLDFIATVVGGLVGVVLI